LFDSAYESYITQKEIPHSIYEIEGAKEVAIEFRSFSKTAGFTGIRCAYTVVPKELIGFTKEKDKISLHTLWNRRSSSKFNGVSYVTQRGAEAVYSEEGKRQVEQNIKAYLENAKMIKKGLQKADFKVYGGENSPYIWLKIPKGKTSWEFFDELLETKNIVGTPRKRIWFKWRRVF
jgi:LL-diaminopimelate aminotransferase